MNRMTRRLLPVLITTALAVLAAWPLSIGNAANAPEPTAIRVTPPAPVFDDAKRLNELASRRKHVADAIGPKAILILFGTEPRLYTNDVDYPFRQENNFYYLTNLNQQREILVLMPGNQQVSEILFLPRRNARAETWTGHMYSPDEAAQLSGVKNIWEVSEFAPFIAALQKHEAYTPKADNVLMSSIQPASTRGLATLFEAADKKDASLYLLANFPANGESREYRQEQRFAAAWPAASGFN